MATESILGRTRASSTATGKKIRLLASVFTNGTMAGSMKDIGSRMICMEKVCTSGPTVGRTKAVSRMTRKTAMEFTRTQMAAVTKECGSTASNMVTAYSCHLKENKERASGTLAKEFSGPTAKTPPARTPSSSRSIRKTKGFPPRAEASIDNRSLISLPSKAR